MSWAKIRGILAAILTFVVSYILIMAATTLLTGLLSALLKEDMRYISSIITIVVFLLAPFFSGWLAFKAYKKISSSTKGFNDLVESTDGRRSAGITIFGWWFIIFIFGLRMYFKVFTSQEYLLETLKQVNSTFNLGYTPLFYKINSGWGALTTIVYVCAGVFILRLNEIGRKVIICLSIAMLIHAFAVSTYLALQGSNAMFILSTLFGSLVFNGLVIYFFTRPKIKEQFK